MNMIEKRKQMRGQGGFTLIELLVVIAILAILAGVVVFAVGNSTKNAKISACKTERGAIITAWAAAKTANEVNASAETYVDYLKSSPEYFAEAGTPVSNFTRVGTEPTSAECAAITAAELG